MVAVLHEKIREQDHPNTKCSPVDNNVWYCNSGVDQTNVDRAARRAPKRKEY